MKRLLILSFSPIASDARVLKQVQEFARDHEVVTCGYGPVPEGAAEHLRIPDDAPINALNGRLITLRWYSRVYRTLPAVRAARDLLRGRRFDVVIANDVEAVPIALDLDVRHGVHADLHEFSPRLHEENPAWARRIAPYVSWLCRRHVARASSWTTVGEGLAREYEREFGFRPRVVTNATPYRDVEPTPVHSPLRMVHSGACLRNRRLDETVRAVSTMTNVTLDLYLTPNDPGHLEELRALAAASQGRVRLLDPVPYARLLDILEGYDLGVHLLAPTNFNNEWALPNKFFDYVQARLGVVIGPSPEMASYVRERGLGIIAEGFGADDLVHALDAVTPDDVAGFKAAAHANARALSAQAQVEIWRDAVTRLEGDAE